MKSHGFTLIEVLLSVAIISLIAGISLPVLGSFNERNNLDIVTQGIVGQLRRAQTYTRGVNGDSQWGVHVQSSDATLFKGTSYVDRDAAFDEITTIPSSITPSGTTDILYSKLEAAPSTAGTITLTNTNNNQSRMITVNAQGMVAY